MNDGDLYVVVLLRPVPNQNEFAFSDYCRTTPKGRPLFGYLNINPRALINPGNVTVYKN